MERSFGVIPLVWKGPSLRVLLVQNRSGAWLLPKGHAHPGEAPTTTAERELREETRLVVERWLDHPPFMEQYEYLKGTKTVPKEVFYFPALVSGEPHLQEEELCDSKWLSLEEAMMRASFPQMRHLLTQVHAWLQSTPQPGSALFS